VRVINDHINLIMVMRSRLALETNSISTPRCREPPVEVGVLRECNAFLVIVIEMAKVPKNFCQHRGAEFATENLFNDSGTCVGKGVQDVKVDSVGRRRGISTEPLWFIGGEGGSTGQLVNVQ